MSEFRLRKFKTGFTKEPAEQPVNLHELWKKAQKKKELKQ